MSIQGQDSFVPTWSGDPADFESYATACRWYQKATKESERKLVVARLWSRLQGAAKSVVKHLDPDQYESESGLQAFLQVLRSSPLQQLPISDSFNRLEKWNHLRRGDKETITELIVREEVLFTELQQALVRARRDRGSELSTVREDPLAGEAEEQPPGTPSRSPIGAFRRRNATRVDGGVIREPAAQLEQTGNDFFSDEMRGYRLLKSCRLSGSERQNVLVQTSNTTHFVLIRRALRTLFADESDRRPRDRFPGKIWWTDEWSDDWDDSGWHSAEWSPTSAYGSEHDAFWADWEWTNDDWSDDWNWDEQGIDWNEELVEPDEQANGPEEASLREAYNIATEASRTLKGAREAVRKVRQARGYYSPEASTGKGLTKNGGNSSKGSKGKSKSKGKQTFGPCFICGKSDHGYRQCPDRHSAYGGKGKPSKGKFFKGKGKGQSKGVFHFHSDYSNDEIQMDIFSSQWDQHALNERKPTWAFLDTGATENAIGEDSLQDMIDAGNFKYHVDVMDRPVFRFGNGQKLGWSGLVVSS